MKARFSLGGVKRNVVKPTYSELELDKLEYACYQRGTNDVAVKKIAKELDWDIFGIISVSYRDGHYYVVDGQHRVEALKLNKTIKTVTCIVWEGLTYEEECEKFIKLNTARKTLNYNQIFNAMVEMKDDVAISVVKILKEYGFDYAKNIGITKDNTINPMQTITNIYLGCGENALRAVLYTIRKAWGGDSSALKCRILCALKTFLHENNSVDMDVLVKALETTTPAALEISGMALSASIGNIVSGSGHGKQIHIANAIKVVYNKVATKGKRVA